MTGRVEVDFKTDLQAAGSKRLEGRRLRQEIDDKKALPHLCILLVGPLRLHVGDRPQLGKRAGQRLGPLVECGLVRRILPDEVEVLRITGQLMQESQRRAADEGDIDQQSVVLQLGH